MVFPARLKVKISSSQSWPAGAELISSELAQTPQAAGFEIRFYDKYETLQNRASPYQILKVVYSGIRHRQGLFPRPAWGIEVRPVPRTLKHAVREALLRVCFPKIRSWLEHNANLDQEYGFHSISVVLDPSSETLLRLEESHSREAK